MMNILHLTVLDEVELWHGLVLVGALFLANILSQLLFLASTTIAHVAGKIRTSMYVKTGHLYSTVIQAPLLADGLLNAKWLRSRYPTTFYPTLVPYFSIPEPGFCCSWSCTPE